MLLTSDILPYIKEMQCSRGKWINLFIHLRFSEIECYAATMHAEC